ncbi:MAG: hypothetical protein V1490_03050 [Candidatus Omnitrophota bacterium]
MKTIKTLHKKARIALKKAVDEVIERHKHTGRPLAIWQHDKVTWVSASQLLRKRIK